MSDETDVTDSQGGPGPLSMEERLEVLEDNIGTANRLARVTAVELVNLRYALLFTVVFLGALYVVGRRS